MSVDAGKLSQLVGASQQTIPSTEAPNSPVDPLASFQSDAHDDGIVPVIPSSLTPPPSSQFISNAAAGAITALGYAASQRTGIFSPPATGLHGFAREVGPASEFTLPTLQKVTEASVEDLRSMLSGCITEHAKLKMEAAHHKLQYSLLAIQADEDAKRAVVEHEMTRKEVEALRMAEHSRQARRDLTSANEASHTKYLQLKVWYDRALEENDSLHKKFKAARKVIQQKEDELAELTDERDMLLNRIRENREHFHILCSPGGMFHGAVTPKTQTATTPAQPQRATPRQTPRSAQREVRTDRDHSNEKEVARLLQGLSQENNSAPSTPLPGHRPVHRAYSKHTRNVQSMSSLPTTPIARSRLGTGALLPSVDLVPQTEPPHRASRLVPQTPPAGKVPERRKSRESTISADDNEELARQALQSVAAATVSFASRVSQHARSMSRPGEEAEEEVWESQASQAASEMLRRDPRESFEVASSVNSRDGTPAPAEKSAKLQAKLFGGLKAGAEKRKLGATGEVQDEGAVREGLSPTKKLRLAGGLRDPGREKPPPLNIKMLPRSLPSLLAKLPTDVVILSSLRTPITRAHRGLLKDAYPEELLSAVLRGTLAAVPELPPTLIEDVAVGVVLSDLGGSKAARAALNHTPGFRAEATALHTVNRACASSLQAVVAVAGEIRTGMIGVGVAAGMESMSRNYGSRAIPKGVWPAVVGEGATKDARDCLMGMGETSENVAERYGVGREVQDQLAAESHARAARARREGWFKGEIVEVRTRWQEVDRKTGEKVGEEREVVVSEDDGIREGVTVEKLAGLKPAFREGGTSTAGNSSQVSDGAAATLMMRRSTAMELGLGGRIMGRFVAATVAGCKPDEMGVGPAVAIPRLLAQLGLEKGDVQRWEINEAFASQAIYCVRELGLEKEWETGKVNPDGGAIALGHPLGATGARMTSTLLHGLKRSDEEVGVVSMCVGTGMGMAGLFVRE
ncbi:Thiolase, N-terminal domain-containing protein [Schizothecium vesticola]|uniref:acetyl-CoA C-acyltransferase n=1 Tax=Schizothecium vesticola TaxID=314040 RepID=A0AA40EPB2_9PEZI|nr:Thiolase, N-terminal domain-containing protein [Schizothecium vesticola]